MMIHTAREEGITAEQQWVEFRLILIFAVWTITETTKMKNGTRQDDPASKVGVHSLLDFNSYGRLIQIPPFARRTTFGEQVTWRLLVMLVVLRSYR